MPQSLKGQIRVDWDTELIDFFSPNKKKANLKEVDTKNVAFKEWADAKWIIFWMEMNDWMSL